MGRSLVGARELTPVGAMLLTVVAAITALMRAVRTRPRSPHDGPPEGEPYVRRGLR
jgi:hypothetical protein